MSHYTKVFKNFSIRLVPIKRQQIFKFGTKLMRRRESEQSIGNEVDVK